MLDFLPLPPLSSNSTVHFNLLLYSCLSDTVQVHQQQKVLPHEYRRLFVEESNGWPGDMLQLGRNEQTEFRHARIFIYLQII